MAKKQRKKPVKKEQTVAIPQREPDPPDFRKEVVRYLREEANLPATGDYFSPQTVMLVRWVADYLDVTERE